MHIYVYIAVKINMKFQMALSVSWTVSEQRQEIIGQQRIDDRSADVLTQSHFEARSWVKVSRAPGE